MASFGGVDGYHFHQNRGDQTHDRQGGERSMKDLYLVSKWALIRRNELVDIP